MTDVVDLPAVEQAALIRVGKLSARELLAASVARIEAVNDAVNAIVTLDLEAAEKRAFAADERYAAGGQLGALHGLTLAIKDSHATAGLRTTRGSRAYAEHVPTEDDLEVSRMRAAGAIIVGKTNLAELGAGSNTFNDVFGATRNPYDLSRSAGGSSGGSAAALAAGMVSLADGSDQGGSLRNPASFCNVVGHRPSPGRVPSWPVNDHWNTLTVQGPMGRTVADAALLLSVQAGPDARVPLSRPESGQAFRAPLPLRLDGMRIAVTPDLGGRVAVEQEVRDIVLRQVEVLTGLGADVTVDCPDLTGAAEVFSTFRALGYVLGLGELCDTVPELVKKAIHWNVAWGRRLTGDDVARAMGLRTKVYRNVDAFFSRYDGLIAPSCQVVPFDVGIEYPHEVAGTPMDDYLAWMQVACLVSATECPATAVPVSFTSSGLPVGIQVVGPHGGDQRTLGIAHAVEHATGAGRRRPHLLPSGGGRP